MWCTHGQCYDIHPVHVKVANRKFCEYPHELTTDVGKSIIALAEDGSIPPIAFNFNSIAAIEEPGAGQGCEVLQGG